ncbi:M15 family metallopeptidase [uncultured Ruminococcus sp.]|uniref:M15 family metallopeptidase n=1 Tax=uncultured Ruminococcus sp. TaxID=165186 RepID=UPI0025D9E7D3|nr:M15 family metallopeptidase [uncultured Ruminococcus sp.]
MDKSKILGLVCLAALLLAGCGNVSNDPDNVRMTEPTTVTSPAETTSIEGLVIIDPNTLPAETSAVPEQQTTMVTTSSGENETKQAATIVLGEVSSKAETGAVITTQDNNGYNGYSHDQPAGNEVIQQNVDYYATQTQPLYTEPPVTDQPQIQDNTPVQQGETANGYKIENINGVTYIDGVLIVNKTYGLPQNYGTGLDPTAQQAFYEMQSAAANDGIWLSIVSGYRSYWYQDQLYWNYVYTRGGQAEVDRFSARAGHSEHQTGLAMDLNNASRWFAGTPEAQWIEEHCADYGFIIRYPDGKEDITGFMYEPWHVRYVGKELARTLTDQGLTLEEYFGIDSVYYE